ncbi:glycosyltransferase family 2 protein [archaeon]|nr:MAG: glycosyltransferase family 2 protein [archaeon]
MVVIDDGSKDRTFEIAKKAGVKVIHHQVNHGKGEAIKTGFNHVLSHDASAKYIVLIDSDMQYLPDELLKLVEPLKSGEADFVIGSRNWSGVPFRHRLGNFVWRTTFNVFFGTRLVDTNCGYMALTRRAVERVRNVHGGYIIENKMISDAVRSRLRIMQVPVKVFYKHKSKVQRGIRVVAGVLIFIIKEGIKYRLGF